MGRAVHVRHTRFGWGLGFDGNRFRRWVMDCCRWIVQVVLRPEQTIMQRACSRNALVVELDSGLAMSAIEQRLRAITTNLGDIHLSRYTRIMVRRTGIKDPTTFQTSLRAELNDL